MNPQPNLTCLNAKNVLFKMDFGVTLMGVINRALVDINNKRCQEGKLELTYSDIPINDPAVYDFIAKGNTSEYFSLGAGITTFVKDLFQDAGTYTKLQTQDDDNLK